MRCVLVSLVAAVLAGFGSLPARAGDPVVFDDRVGLYDRYEVSAGADATRQSATVYTATTAALFGVLREDGLRLRAGAGYGTYSYSSPRWNGLTRVPVSFEGEQSFADLLVGYQASVGPMIVKLFVGGAMERHVITPFDSENGVQGDRVGLKGALETWLRFGDRAFLQTDASWSSMFEAYSARARLGTALFGQLSAGIEAAAMGNRTYDAGRAGLFTRYEWTGGEISVSGGTAGDRSGLTGGYGSIGIVVRF